MSRLCRSLWCFALNGWFHFWKVCLEQSYKMQDIDFSIKFTELYQIAASAATPSSFFNTGWTFPVKGNCAAWPSYWTFLLPASSFLCASISGHRFSTIFFLAPHSTPRRLSFPFRSVHRFRLSPHTPHVCAYPPSARIRSFPCSKTDRPSRTFGICRWQNCRS